MNNKFNAFAWPFDHVNLNLENGSSNEASTSARFFLGVTGEGLEIPQTSVNDIPDGAPIGFYFNGNEVVPENNGLFQVEGGAAIHQPIYTDYPGIEIVVPPPVVAEEEVAEMVAIAKETSAENFDVTEEVKKIKEFLETQPKQPTIVNQPISKVMEEVQHMVEAPVLVNPEITVPVLLIKCSYCDYVFIKDEFEKHICNCDENGSMLCPPSPTRQQLEEKQRLEKMFPAEDNCTRVLRENQIRIRRFLKEELKYDLVNSSAHNAAISASAKSLPIDVTQPLSTGGATKKHEGPHRCHLCDRKFVHASGLLRHMEKHAMDLIPTPGNQIPRMSHIYSYRLAITCSFCGRVHFEAKAAVSHLVTMHFMKPSEKEADITETDRSWADILAGAAQFIKSQMQEEISVNCDRLNAVADASVVYFHTFVVCAILQCEFCDFMFVDPVSLLSHSACHSPERRFECFACNVKINTLKEVTTHWQSECVYQRENYKMHLTCLQRYFICNVCQEGFPSLEQLFDHRYSSQHFFPRRSMETKKLLLPCEHCTAIFERTADYLTHYEECHSKKYKRDKEFDPYSGKSRQYLCDICGKSYTQSSHLWQHLRFHQGVKPFACREPGCSRKFTIRPDLNDHIRKCHTGERPYHCLVCGKRFLTGSVFYQHRLIHRGERRYECEECGKRFYRADALKNHQRIHTGEKPFGCHFCTKHFRQRGDRDKHIRARHAYLNDNTRLLMQMQKMQLEASEAAKNGTVEAEENLIPLNAIIDAGGEVFEDRVVIANMSFPMSMFQPIVNDIDSADASVINIPGSLNTTEFEV